MVSIVDKWREKSEIVGHVKRQDKSEVVMKMVVGEERVRLNKDMKLKII